MAALHKLKKLTPENRIKELECLVEKQGEMIERLRSAKVSLPIGKRKKDGDSFVRVVCGDTHGAYRDEAACKAFFQDLDILKPAEVVHGGDAIDCGGFLAQHHVIGVVPECAITFEQDVLCANDFLDKVERYAPGSCKDLLLGNHDHRIEKAIIKWTMGNHSNAKYLFSMFSPEKVLNLEKRGIRCVKYDQFYDGMTVRGTIYKDHCAFRHGTRYGENATRQTLNDFGCNIVHFHTHRMIMHSRETYKGLIAAWSCPCLSVIRPLYGLTDITGWAHGYIIQVVSKKGFITIQVPIINGVSFLQPLVTQLNLR